MVRFKSTRAVSNCVHHIFHIGFIGMRVSAVVPADHPSGLLKYWTRNLERSHWKSERSQRRKQWALLDKKMMSSLPVATH